MLTGHATVESAIEGTQKGAFDYFMKPCDIELLVSKVTEAAARKRRHEEKIIEAQLKEITIRRTYGRAKRPSNIKKQYSHKAAKNTEKQKIKIHDALKRTTFLCAFA